MRFTVRFAPTSRDGEDCHARANDHGPPRGGSGVGRSRLGPGAAPGPAGRGRRPDHRSGRGRLEAVASGSGHNAAPDGRAAAQHGASHQGTHGALRAQRGLDCLADRMGGYDAVEPRGARQLRGPGGGRAAHRPEERAAVAHDGQPGRAREHHAVARGLPARPRRGPAHREEPLSERVGRRVSGRGARRRRRASLQRRARDREPDLARPRLAGARPDGRGVGNHDRQARPARARQGRLERREVASRDHAPDDLGRCERTAAPAGHAVVRGLRRLGRRTPRGGRPQVVGFLGAAGDRPMMNLEEATVARTLHRAAIYRLLGLAFAYPAGDHLHAVAALSSAAAADPWAPPDISAALAVFAAAAREIDAELAAQEHVLLFDRQAPCAPYEGAYGAGNVAGKAAGLADVAGFYAAFGMAPATARPEMEDHIAAELEFMSVLALKEAHATVAGHGDGFAVTRAAAASYLAEHLGRWAATFAATLAAATTVPYYRQLAGLLELWVAADADTLGVTLRPVDTPAGSDPIQTEETFTCPMVSGDGPNVGEPSVEEPR